MVVLRILSWDSSRSWTSWGPAVRSDLEGRLKSVLGLSPLEIKRLARQVLDREVTELLLDQAPDALGAEPVRHILEALGAEVEIGNA
jgi:hypothetical protein